MQHDNALEPSAVSVQQFLAAKNVAFISHPSYLPDLTTAIYLVFENEIASIWTSFAGCY